MSKITVNRRSFNNLPLRFVALPLCFVAAIALSACATQTTQNQSGDKSYISSVTPSKIEQDRKAILAMTGTYRVTFDFTETVALKEGYTLKDPKLSGGHEVVRVIRNDPKFISLQHILVVGKDKKFPVKHWRQDWVYEPDYIYDFVGFNSWKKRELTPSESKGKWAQVVYQVDDSPRYAAVADWKHENGLSAWSSPPNMRPLPRRDMTTRDDYHGVLAVNRHAITPMGWVHEQDNTKLILTGETPQALVREVGVNTYIKSEDFDIEIADDYWDKTKDYWAGIRDIWTRLEAENNAMGLTIQGETTDLYMPIMDMTDKIETAKLPLATAIENANTIIESFFTPDIKTSIASAKHDALSLKKAAY